MATQPWLVNKQFNSPINLYSAQNVQEVIERDSQLLSNGKMGINFYNPQAGKPTNLQNSAVLRMLQEEESRRDGHLPGVKRVAWPPPRDGDEFEEHGPVQSQGGPQNAPSPGLQNSHSPVQQSVSPGPQYRSPLKPLDISSASSTPSYQQSPRSPVLNASPVGFRPQTPTRQWAPVQSPAAIHSPLTVGQSHYQPPGPQQYQPQPPKQQYQPAPQQYQPPQQQYQPPQQHQPPQQQYQPPQQQYQQQHTQTTSQSHHEQSYETSQQTQHFSQLQTLTAEQQRQISQLQAQITKQQQQIVQLQSQISQQQQPSAQLQNLIAQHQQQINQLQSQISQQQSVQQPQAQISYQSTQQRSQTQTFQQQPQQQQQIKQQTHQTYQQQSQISQPSQQQQHIQQYFQQTQTSQPQQPQQPQQQQQQQIKQQQQTQSSQQQQQQHQQYQTSQQDQSVQWTTQLQTQTSLQEYHSPQQLFYTPQQYQHVQEALSQPQTPQTPQSASFNQQQSAQLSAKAGVAPSQAPGQYRQTAPVKEPPPSTITLRPEAPVSQAPPPVYSAQPATATLKGGKHLRGDLKWPPENVRILMDEENRKRIELSKGPMFKPKRPNKDYSQFFAQHALNSSYPGYKIPPGTQFYRPE